MSNEPEIMQMVKQLSPEDLALVHGFLHLGVYSVGFRAALAAATPPGEKRPPMEVVDRLVKEWMEKEQLEVPA